MGVVRIIWLRLRFRTQRDDATHIEGIVTVMATNHNIMLDIATAHSRNAMYTATIHGALSCHLKHHLDAGSNPLIDYKSLEEICDLGSISLGKNLSMLMDEDKANARPLRSGLVVSRNGLNGEYIPSPGFFKHAKKLGYQFGTGREEELGFWIKQLVAMGIDVKDVINNILYAPGSNAKEDLYLNSFNDKMRSEAIKFVTQYNVDKTLYDCRGIKHKTTADAIVATTAIRSAVSFIFDENVRYDCNGIQHSSAIKAAAYTVAIYAEIVAEAKEESESARWIKQDAYDADIKAKIANQRAFPELHDRRGAKHDTEEEAKAFNQLLSKGLIDLRDKRHDTEEEAKASDKAITAERLVKFEEEYDVPHYTEDTKVETIKKATFDRVEQLEKLALEDENLSSKELNIELEYFAKIKKEILKNLYDSNKDASHAHKTEADTDAEAEVN